MYNQSGTPTAAVLKDDSAIIDYKLYWVACRDLDEAHFLLAVINSDALAEAVNRYTTPNWAGKTRDLQKHLWRLPIPEFDALDSAHVAVSDAGRLAAEGVERELANLRQQYARLMVTIARREIRKWLRESAEGKRVEEVVGVLLGDG